MSRALVIVLVWFATFKVFNADCKCGQQDSIDEVSPLECLLGEDEDIRLSRLPNEAVCAQYDLFEHMVTQDLYCNFRQERTIISDICRPGGICIIQNPSYKEAKCYQGQTYCNYLIRCPSSASGVQLPILLCQSLDLPFENSASECHDKVTLFSNGLVNGREDVCGSRQNCFPYLISVGDIEIKYASSLCCHNCGFRFVSYCSAPLPWDALLAENTLSDGDPELIELETKLPSYDELIDAEIVQLPINANLTFGSGELTILFPSNAIEEKKTYRNISILEVYDCTRDTLLHFNSSITTTIHGYGVLRIGTSIAQYLFLRIPLHFIPSSRAVRYITRVMHNLSNRAARKVYNNQEVKLKPTIHEEPVQGVIVEPTCNGFSLETPAVEQVCHSSSQSFENDGTNELNINIGSGDYGEDDVPTKYKTNPFVLGLKQKSFSP